MKTLKYFFVGALLLSMQMPAMAQDVKPSQKLWLMPKAMLQQQSRRLRIS